MRSLRVETSASSFGLCGNPLEDGATDVQRKNSLAKIEQSSAENVAEPLKPSAKPIKPERASKMQSSPKSRDSAEERRPAGGSSGSEHDSEMDSKHRIPRQVGAVEEESAGLVSQDSYDEELPYETCPVERPRSTTPLNISCLQEYCGAAALTDDLDCSIQRGEKLRISLPRKDIKDSVGSARSKSPRRVSNASGKSWFEFAEQGIGGGTLSSPSNSHAKEIHADDTRRPSKPTTEWIDLENIPEKRKPAKRITTLPHKDAMLGESSHQVQYNYVNPDECQCDCHGNERDGSNNTDSERKESLTEDQSPDDCVPLLESDPEENVLRNPVNEPLERPVLSAETWKQQTFDINPQDSSKAKRSSFDSGDSLSPVYARSNKTTTVQLPQRHQH